jgi:hypothetical protein
MTKLEQAARHALEALETDEQWGFVNKKVLERRIPAIAALRTVLEQPEADTIGTGTAEERLQEATNLLLLVRDNLFQGMPKSFQKLQAQAINEELGLPKWERSYD